MDLSERGAAATRHPWEVVRAEFFRALIAESVDLTRVERLVDVGAGDGWFAQELLGSLPARARVTCWDIHYTDEDLTAALPARIERTVEPPDGPADLVTLLDVLEHVADDRAFLADAVVPLLGSSGTLIVSVPAHPHLFSAHDEALHHERRYRRRDLLGLLAQHLEITASGPLFTSLLAPRLAQVGLERLGRRSETRGVGAWHHGRALTGAVTTGLRADVRLGRAAARRRIPLPGLSVWAVCRPRGAR